jgi:hypothetical protein
MKKYQVEVEVTKTYKALVEVEITEDIDGDDFQRVVEEEVESMDQEKLDYKETNHLVLKINDYQIEALICSGSSRLIFIKKKLEHDSGVYLSIENSATLPLKTQPPL